MSDFENVDTGLQETFESEDIQVTLHDPSNPISSVSKFEDLELPEDLLRGIYAMNFRKPSKIQEKALPLLLKDPPTNMIAQSQSGTGKTAAFSLAMLYRVDPKVQGIQALCVANTRELASQICQVIKQMGAQLKISVGLAVPESYSEIQSTQVVVGAPGSILNCLKKSRRVFDNLKVLVIDEADEMLAGQNMTTQLNDIKRAIPQVQVLLFSATFPNAVLEFAKKFAPKANMITLKIEEVKVDAIRQFSLTIPTSQKLKKLSDVYGLLTIGQSIIFVQQKSTAYQVQRHMVQEGHQVSVLTSDETPSSRDRIMNDFRNGTSKVLIATNVLSRGIDVPQVNLVVNFEMPMDRSRCPDTEVYVHRIGRTGRFGRSGVSINFLDTPESEAVQSKVIEQFNMKISELNDLEEMEKMLHEFKLE